MASFGLCLIVMEMVVSSVLLAWLTTTSWAAGASLSSQRPRDLTELSLEELMNIEVTTASKKTEKLSEAATAVYVITQEDIRRSGVTSIPEALRLAPGLTVGRVDAHTWAISARGFNDIFANKLLVLIDGRSVYTPLFSGVYWDVQDTFLEDVERIEVIRGPGATVWGANAVNGVINIITKRAKDTQGTVLTGGGGTEERAFGSLRYGSKLSEDAYFRVYAKYFNRDDSVLPGGADAHDHWQIAQGGFRMDWHVSDGDLLTLQGDLYGGNLHQIFTTPLLIPPFARTFKTDIDVAGGNFLGRWSHSFSGASELTLQMYYDRTRRQSPIFTEVRDTYDIDLQHRFLLGKRQAIVWGLGYRLSHDKTEDSFTVSINPDSRTTNLLSAFAQDEIGLVEDRLRLTLGVKFEHNDFTGFEIQPGARLVWMPHDRHTVWASVSRAVRTPSRAEDDIRIVQQVLPPGQLFQGAPVAVVAAVGNRDFDSEELLAYGLGYRVRPNEWLSLDFAAFYHVYTGLRSLEPGPPFLETSPAPPHLVVPMFAANKLDGETYGIEAVSTWQVTDWWRLRTLYSYLQVQLHRRKSSRDTTSELAEGNDPHHQFSVRSLMDLPGHVEFDVALRYVDSLPNLRIPSYAVFDVRLGWRLTKNLEASIVGQNLLKTRHPEFVPSFIRTPDTEVQHGVYAKLVWRF